MADFAYTYGLAGLMGLTAGPINLQTGDIRVRLVMTNTTCDTEKDATVLSGFTTLDTMNGANYVDKALTTEAVTAVTASDRGKFDADDVTWTALGVGTRNVLAAVVYKFVTNDTDSIPIFYLDSGFSSPTGVAANGGDFKITWHTDGIGYSATA